jgi:uncharacterized protein YjbI with pentapeptide repeats
MDPLLELKIRNHQVWLESNGVSGEQLDLSGQDLSEIDFDHLNLSRAVLRDVDMRYCRCRGADFSGADLYGSNLRQASFDGSSLRGANLNGCSLQAASFEKADLTEAGLSDSDLTSADFSDAVMVRACLRGSICFETVFFGADLSAADLSYMAVWRTGIDAAASLIEANLAGIDLKGTYPPSAEKLLEARSLYDIRHLDYTKLRGYEELSTEDRAKLDRLRRTRPE